MGRRHPPIIFTRAAPVQFHRSHESYQSYLHRQNSLRMLPEEECHAHFTQIPPIPPLTDFIFRRFSRPA